MLRSWGKGVHALDGSIWGLCSPWAWPTARCLEGSGTGGRLVKISDAAACPPEQCPPVLTGHWVLGFLRRCGFLL